MENISKIILVAILIITASNLSRNFFSDSSLKKVEKNLELTKNSLDSAIASNKLVQDKIKKMDLIISGYKVKNEKLQSEIEIIDLEEERTKVATIIRRDQIDVLLKAKRERLVILKEKDTVFD
tara:strand:+ start:513 stop:881 length:369 start_codon:yes stop_codon:yes gene_type:complete